MRTDNKNESRNKPFRVPDIIHNIQGPKNGEPLTNINDVKNALPFFTFRRIRNSRMYRSPRCVFCVSNPTREARILRRSCIAVITDV